MIQRCGEIFVVPTLEREDLLDSPCLYLSLISLMNLSHWELERTILTVTYWTGILASHASNAMSRQTRVLL